MSDRARAELWLARGMLAFAVAALVAAAILPFRARCSRGINEAPLPAVSPEAALCEYACDRNALREAELNELRDIIGSPATGDELRVMAQRRMMALMAWMEQEATIEAVLSARGMPPLLVTVRADSVNVVASAPLSQGEAEAALELIARETGVSGGNIRIIAPMS